MLNTSKTSKSHVNNIKKNRKKFYVNDKQMSLPNEQLNFFRSNF